MKKSTNPRRNFIKASVFDLRNLAVLPIEKGMAEKEALMEKKINETKLNIICVCALPGDPELGCSGTMATYSQAGHNVSFVYLTRGEANYPNKTHTQMAALRTEEANISCKILTAKPIFAGQIDGNTELNNTRNEEFSNLIKSLKPDIVFPHWPMDTHPDHQIAGLLTLNAGLWFVVLSFLSPSVV